MRWYWRATSRVARWFSARHERVVTPITALVCATWWAGDRGWPWKAVTLAGWCFLITTVQFMLLKAAERPDPDPEAWADMVAAKPGANSSAMGQAWRDRQSTDVLDKLAAKRVDVNDPATLTAMFYALAVASQIQDRWPTLEDGAGNGFVSGFLCDRARLLEAQKGTDGSVLRSDP